MIEFISFVSFILLFFVLIINNIRVSLKLSLTYKQLLQANIDKTVLAEKLFELSAKDLLKKETDSDAFLKFISDSRDWAYEYIENVQAGIKSFVDEVGPQIEYYDEYGASVDGMVAPHDFALKKISSEFKKLKKLLPEDYDKIEE